MTSFASRVRAALVAVAALAVARSAPAEPDAAAVAPVQQAIGKRWSVPAESVRLDWGQLPASGVPSTPFRLLGGSDGWFVLAFGSQSGEVASVRVRAGVDETVRVATRDLARGEKLEPQDMRVESRVAWGTPRGGSTLAEAGWVLRRAVAAGAVLDRPTAEPPTLVNPGDCIALEWNRGTVALRLTGVAVTGARLGEMVRVRVEGRPRPLLGWVDAPGHARIGAREAS